ncbi:MAG TPA: HYR domain-containing protein, partial [Thermoanaerobaculia bacterium]
MRVQKIVFLVAIVCLLPLTAAAQISRISPTSLELGKVEEFLTVFGSGLSGTELTRVVFNGPAGEFSIEPGNYLPSSDPDAIPQFPDTVLQAWVPVLVAITPGTYDIYVVAKNVGEATRTLGPVQFTVLEPPLDGPPIITTTESIFQEAQTANGAVVYYDVSAHSQDGTPLDVSCSHPSGSNFPMGLTSVSCSATDSFGTTNATFYVVVADFTSPVVTVPDDIVTESRDVTFTASAVDNIDGVL